MVYGTILGLALVALVVDRMVLPDSATRPQAATAATAQAPARSSEAAASSTTASLASHTVAAPSLANRLQNLAQQRRLVLTDVPDAFRPNLNWVGTAPTDVAPSEVKNPQIALTEIEAFSTRNRLMAVLNNSDGGAAIVGSRTLVVGQVIDEFQLMSLTKRSAVFKKGELRVELKLPDPRLPTAD